jgi:predicted RNase H-like nuclease (RuvC/YqgF family)
VKTLVKAHALDWITAALAATAVALFILAMARAAGAASSNQAMRIGDYESERRTRAEAVGADFERALRKVVADLDYTVESFERVFEHDLERLERGVDAAFDDYERDGDRRAFDRRVKDLEVRLAQVGKRIDKLANAVAPGRTTRAY